MIDVGSEIINATMIGLAGAILFLGGYILGYQKGKEE